MKIDKPAIVLTIIGIIMFVVGNILFRLPTRDLRPHALLDFYGITGANLMLSAIMIICISIVMMYKKNIL